MRLLSIHIENFRGIQALDLELGAVTVLVGENNSGKTSVLDALKLCLRDLRSRQGNLFEPYDFFLATPNSEPRDAPPIKVILTFGELAAGEWPEAVTAPLARARILQVSPVSGLSQVTLQVTGAFSASGEPEHDFVFLDVSGNALRGADPRALNTLHERISFFYLSALRDAARHFDSKGQFWRHFLRASTLTPEQRAGLETSLRTVNDQVIASHTSFETARARLQRLNDVVPFAGGTTVSIEALPARLFDMLARTQVSIGATNGSQIPIGRHGDGTQSLAVVMLFHAFLEASATGTPLLALEEPEAHLHPNAIRSLWRVIAALPGQKILTTHSGDMLSEVPMADLRRLSRSTGAVRGHRFDLSQLTDKQRRQLEFHVRQSRGELLFARCWLLVEGETEVTVLPAVARRLGTPLERFGVRCVPYRHADIGLYLNIAGQLGISWCSVFEGDTQGLTDLAKAKGALAGRAEADAIVELPVGTTIEEYLATNGFEDVYDALVPAQNRALITAPPGTPAYTAEVLAQVGGKKTEAATDIALRIETGTAVPPFIQQIVELAVRLGSAG